MTWATPIIKQLQNGETVTFRPRGNSMKGRVESGQKVTVVPVGIYDSIDVDDVVLCKVHGYNYLHLVKDVDNGRYLIGNNNGGINGWIKKNAIYGRMIE